MVKAVGASGLGAPPDTYLLALAQADTCWATIGSDDALRLFDPALTLLHTVQPPGRAGLACLQRVSHHAVAAAGRDGWVRLWDARTPQRPAQQWQELHSRPISALACHQHVIAAGTESTKEGLGDVSVLLYDARHPSAPLRNYAESHTDSITQLAFGGRHQPNVLLSGSTDGLVSLFDVDQADEEDALLQVLNPRSAVHCAGFLTPDQAYVVTTDEHFLVYPLREPADGSTPAPVTDFGDVRHTLDCMYVVDLLRQPDGQPLVAYGHNARQTLSLVQLSGPDPWRWGPAVQLPGAHGDEVVRDMRLTENRAYSCGEDGQVRVWQW